MPNSVSDGPRPSAARMRSYSSAVMLCAASTSGVIFVGSGTTAAEEAVVIAATCIFARAMRDDSLQRGSGYQSENNQLAECHRPIVIANARCDDLAGRSP